ncbi:Phosphatidylinositol 4,5-bisphosphate-binding protein SLM1 [Ceratocystis lukuohia]|uniref:Phosphatidylinositol 4,5-bisphosphate-binding protein SLM1 n=1 Tax=Ceratocystis lukuohia TaxID=2019550 RepID=A0ABR4MB72_9PEZI
MATRAPAVKDTLNTAHNVASTTERALGSATNDSAPRSYPEHSSAVTDAYHDIEGNKSASGSKFSEGWGMKPGDGGGSKHSRGASTSSADHMILSSRTGNNSHLSSGTMRDHDVPGAPSTATHASQDFRSGSRGYNQEQLSSPFHCPIPTDTNPSEILASRFEDTDFDFACRLEYRQILKDLIAYFKETGNHYESRAKAHQRLQQAVASFTMPQEFLQTRGLSDGLGVLQSHSRLAVNEAEKSQAIEEDVIAALTSLRSELSSKIKEIRNLAGDFKSNIEQEIDNTKKSVRSLNDAISQNASGTEPSVTGKSDPYLLRHSVDRQVEKQLKEENYIQQAHINLETSGRELESIVVYEIQKSFNAIAGMLKRESTLAYNTSEDLRSGVISMPRDAEWDHWLKSRDEMFLTNVPRRTAQQIIYPGMDHPSCHMIRSGPLERKGKYLKSFTAGWYVLSPTHLHEFKSADSPTPVMSLYLPDQTLGSHSASGGSNNKFILKGRQTGTLHRGHTWIFRAESYQDMLGWYKDIKDLLEPSAQTAGSSGGAALGSAALQDSEAPLPTKGNHKRTTSSYSSTDSVLDEEDETPWAGINCQNSPELAAAGVATKKSASSRPGQSGTFQPTRSQNINDSSMVEPHETPAHGMAKSSDPATAAAAAAYIGTPDTYGAQKSQPHATSHPSPVVHNHPINPASASPQYQTQSHQQKQHQVFNPNLGPTSSTTEASHTSWGPAAAAALAAGTAGAGAGAYAMHRRNSLDKGPEEPSTAVHGQGQSISTTGDQGLSPEQQKSLAARGFNVNGGATTSDPTPASSKPQAYKGQDRLRTYPSQTGQTPETSTSTAGLHGSKKLDTDSPQATASGPDPTKLRNENAAALGLDPSALRNENATASGPDTTRLRNENATALGLDPSALRNENATASGLDPSALRNENATALGLDPFVILRNEKATASGPDTTKLRNENATASGPDTTKLRNENATASGPDTTKLRNENAAALGLDPSALRNENATASGPDTTRLRNENATALGLDPSALRNKNISRPQSSWSTEEIRSASPANPAKTAAAAGAGAGAGAALAAGISQKDKQSKDIATTPSKTAAGASSSTTMGTSARADAIQESETWNPLSLGTQLESTNISSPKSAANASVPAVGYAASSEDPKDITESHKYPGSYPDEEIIQDSGTHSLGDDVGTGTTAGPIPSSSAPTTVPSRTAASNTSPVQSQNQDYLNKPRSEESESSNPSSTSIIGTMMGAVGLGGAAAAMSSSNKNSETDQKESGHADRDLNPRDKTVSTQGIPIDDGTPHRPDISKAALGSSDALPRNQQPSSTLQDRTKAKGNGKGTSQPGALGDVGKDTQTSMSTSTSSSAPKPGGTTTMPTPLTGTGVSPADIGGPNPMGSEGASDGPNLSTANGKQLDVNPDEPHVLGDSGRPKAWSMVGAAEKELRELGQLPDDKTPSGPVPAPTGSHDRRSSFSLKPTPRTNESIHYQMSSVPGQLIPTSENHRRRLSQVSTVDPKLRRESLNTVDSSKSTSVFGRQNTNEMTPHEEPRSESSGGGMLSGIGATVAGAAAAAATAVGLTKDSTSTSDQRDSNVAAASSSNDNATTTTPSRDPRTSDYAPVGSSTIPPSHTAGKSSTRDALPIVGAASSNSPEYTRQALARKSSDSSISSSDYDSSDVRAGGTRNTSKMAATTTPGSATTGNRLRGTADPEKSLGPNVGDMLAGAAETVLPSTRAPENASGATLGAVPPNTRDTAGIGNSPGTYADARTAQEQNTQSTTGSGAGLGATVAAALGAGAAALGLTTSHDDAATSAEQKDKEYSSSISSSSSDYEESHMPSHDSWAPASAYKNSVTSAGVASASKGNAPPTSVSKPANTSYSADGTKTYFETSKHTHPRTSSAIAAGASVGAATTAATAAAALSAPGHHDDDLSGTYHIGSSSLKHNTEAALRTNQPIIDEQSEEADNTYRMAGGSVPHESEQFDVPPGVTSKHVHPQYPHTHAHTPVVAAKMTNKGPSSYHMKSGQLDHPRDDVSGGAALHQGAGSASRATSKVASGTAPTATTRPGTGAAAGIAAGAAAGATAGAATLAAHNHSKSPSNTASPDNSELSEEWSGPWNRDSASNANHPMTLKEELQETVREREARGLGQSGSSMNPTQGTNPATIGSDPTFFASETTDSTAATVGSNSSQSTPTGSRAAPSGLGAAGAMANTASASPSGPTATTGVRSTSIPTVTGPEAASLGDDQPQDAYTIAGAQDASRSENTDPSQMNFSSKDYGMSNVTPAASAGPGPSQASNAAAIGGESSTAGPSMDKPLSTEPAAMSQANRGDAGSPPKDKHLATRIKEGSSRLFGRNKSKRVKSRAGSTDVPAPYPTQ